MILWSYKVARCRQTKEKVKMENNNASSNPTVIAALAAAKARLAAKSAPTKAPVNVTDRAAAVLQREKEREERRLKREAEKSAKLAARAQKPSRLDKAAAGLPPLSEGASTLFNDATTNLNHSDLTALAAHLSYHLRAEATKAAATAKIEEGTRVRITGGDAKWLGQIGLVVRAQRIRCFVALDADPSRQVYLFLSDVTPVEDADEVTDDEGAEVLPEAEASEPQESTGTEG